MKAHIKTPTIDVNTEQAVREAVSREVSAQYDTMYQSIAEDVSRQTLCYVFWTLHTSCGWGKKRLKEFEADLLDTAHLSGLPDGSLGKVDPDAIADLLLRKFDIDLRTAFSDVKCNCRE